MVRGAVRVSGGGMYVVGVRWEWQPKGLVISRIMTQWSVIYEVSGM